MSVDLETRIFYIIMGIAGIAITMTDDRLTPDDWRELKHHCKNATKEVMSVVNARKKDGKDEDRGQAT